MREKCITSPSRAPLIGPCRARLLRRAARSPSRLPAIPSLSLPPLRYILFPVQNASPPQTAPTQGLYLGLVITVLAVLAYAAYITIQFAGLRELQSELVDRNRRDSLQLLRIQNDLNSLGLAMRDMQDPTEPYPIIAWVPQFERIRTDLVDALEQESALSEAAPTSDQRGYLNQSLAQFWDSVNRMFALRSEEHTSELQS